jgi:hypothetical protein
MSSSSRRFSNRKNTEPEQIILTGQGKWAGQSTTLQEANPDRPDYCPPFANSKNAASWLQKATNGLTNLCENNEGKHRESIDQEVIAAICICKEIESSADLQREWCGLPGWTTVKRKRPREGNTQSVLEEVFRYFWSIVRGDQDGFELRYRAVKAHYKADILPTEIVESIHKNGGYRAVSRSNVVTAGMENTVEDAVSTVDKVEWKPRFKVVEQSVFRKLAKLNENDEVWVKIRAQTRAGHAKTRLFELVDAKMS